jgi:hypothetical protein
VPVCPAKIATCSEDAKMMRHYLPVASPLEKRHFDQKCGSLLHFCDAFLLTQSL